MDQQQGQGQNPYLALLSKLQSQQAPQAPNQSTSMIQHLMGQGGQAPQMPGSNPAQAGGGMPPQAGGGAQQPDIEDAAIPGQNPGISKNLLGAMSQLHGAITQMTDPEEIRMIRSIIIMLNQLIQRDQSVQDKRTGSLTQPQPGQSNLSSGPQEQGPIPSGLTPGSPSPSA